MLQRAGGRVGMEKPDQLQHGEYILQKSGSALVPKAVANLWLTYTAYGNAVCTQQEPAPAVVNPVNVALATENDELKVRLANLEKALHEARANPSGKTLSDLGSTPSPEEIAEAAETPKTTSKKK